LANRQQRLHLPQIWQLLTGWYTSRKRTMLPSMLWFLRPFHWRYSSVFGAGLWFAGVGAMVGDKYTVAIVFYVLGLLWLVGWWLVEHPGPNHRKGQTQWTSKQIEQIRIRWLGALVPIAITAFMLFLTLHLKVENELKQHAGPLHAGHKPTPPNTCPIQPGSLGIFSVRMRRTQTIFHIRWCE
jgi:hypothetical protein